MTRTALVVDDEDLVRSVTAIVLRQAGYEVREAGDADAALAAFRAGPVDLVVLDRTLPGRSGAEVLAELRALDPWVPVLLTSGSDPDPGLLAGATGYLPKPFDARGLLAAVRQVLGGEEEL